VESRVVLKESRLSETAVHQDAHPASIVGGELSDLLQARHRDFVARIVGMGREDLNVRRDRDRVIPYRGLPLDPTMNLIASADLFLGIVSCVLHAADLARVPGVGLFGPTRAAIRGFRFAPHRHLDQRMMADITTEAVLIAMEDVAAQHV
jgi:hypothetical protein